MVTDRGYIWRTALVAVALLAVWGGLAARLGFLHLGESEALRERVRGMRAVEETILVGRGRIFDRNGQLMALDLPVQISHIGSMAGFGQMARFLAMADEYRMNGLDLGCDCYPYSAFSTALGSTTYDEGWLDRIALKDAIARLDPRQRSILALRFCQGKTQMEVSSEIGISQAQVSRLEKTALSSIRKNM